jgi:hypothetical protein
MKNKVWYLYVSHINTTCTDTATNIETVLNTANDMLKHIFRDSNFATLSTQNATHGTLPLSVAPGNV